MPGLYAIGLIETLWITNGWGWILICLADIIISSFRSRPAPTLG